MNENQGCIDHYISSIPEEIQPLLHQVKETIRQVLPDAMERISWGMPTYWQDHNIIHFAAFKKHIGIYPGPAAIVHFESSLRDYKTSKGAIQLPFDQPLPLELIADITKWCYQSGNHP